MSDAAYGMISDVLLPLAADTEEKFNPLAAGDVTLLIWTGLAFLLLMLLLTAKLWKPLMNIIEERETKIASDLESAEAARKEAEEAREAHRKSMDEAAAEARGVLEEARTRADQLRAELERDAKVQADEIREKATREIEAEKARALDEIREHVVDLSMEITRSVVGKDVASKEDVLAQADGMIAKLKASR